ncbi:syntaxin binding protein 1 [Malassezia cuniculi]|uniref:Syntaxin binding protein 1 n=1 Tax=Malassezia cuniculi TaxID=948313 RepID=A0AAF0EQL6_9BASI|nr:syntaxin binding protein 1 [Malassezia cuniculi]
MPAKSLQTLVKQRYLGILQSVRPASQWKALVVDSVTMQLLASVMRMFDILEQRVTKVENIEKYREPSPGNEAIYLLTATSQNVRRLIKELAPAEGPPQFDAAHVFFVDALSDTLADQLMQSRAAPRLKQLQELFIHMWPIEAQVFTLKDPQAFYSLYQPLSGTYSVGSDESIAALQVALDEATRNLFNLCVTLNEFPLIRYYNPGSEPLGPLSKIEQGETVDRPELDKPNPRAAKDAVHVGEPFTKQLALRVQAALDEYTKGGQMLGEPGRPPSVLLITDRSMDAVSPFLHEFTYQAMINDLLHIEDGTKYKHSYTNSEGIKEEQTVELSDEDDIWVAIRHLHIAEAVEYLTKQFQQHMGEQSEFSANQSISGMRDMLASLPHMQSTKEKLSVHLSLAQKCMDHFEKSRLPQQAMVEQNSATHHTPEGGKPRSLVEDMVTLLDDPRVSNADKVRIIALYIMFCDGVQDEDRKRLFQHARLSNGEIASVNNLVHLGVRVVRDQSGSGLDALFKKRRRQLQQRTDKHAEEYELSRYQPLVRTMIEDHVLGKLDQSLFPYVRNAPEEHHSLSSTFHRSTGGSFSASASDMASSLMSHAISATGGRDSPFARVGRGHDASSASSRVGTSSLRSARPTWHQKSRSNSVVPTPATAGGAGAGGAVVPPGSRPSMSEMSNPNAQRVMVFVAGGMTYSEMRTAYLCGKRLSADVYIGSSHVLTPDSFMEALRLLGSSRQPNTNAGQRRVNLASQDKPSSSGLLHRKQAATNQPSERIDYAQNMSPQERYDLTFETEDVPPPPPPQAQPSGLRKLSNTLGKDKSATAPQSMSPQTTPVPAQAATASSASLASASASASAPHSAPGTQSASSILRPKKLEAPRIGKDLSRFKQAFSFKK